MLERTLQLSGYREQKQAEALKSRANLMIDRDYALDVEMTRIAVGMSNRQLDAAYNEPRVVMVDGSCAMSAANAPTDTRVCCCRREEAANRADR